MEGRSKTMTHNGLHCMDWQPSLSRVFVPVLVLTGRVLKHVSICGAYGTAEYYTDEERDAYSAVRID